MNPIRIFNMKRINKLIIILELVITFLFLTSCSYLRDMFEVKVVSCDGKITLSCPEDIVNYFPYEELPSFDITFDGSINITKERQGVNECIFTKNDDLKVSVIIKSLINKYLELDSNRVKTVLISTDRESETWMNYREDGRDEKIYFKVMDSAVYNEIVYILLENGLILSINYARFVDEDNVTYYRWQKTQSIRVVLHYPFKITTDTTKVPNKLSSNKSFILLSLPLGVTYSFDTTTKRLEKLLEDDKFLEDTYYTYQYVNNYETDHDDIVNYYITYFSGRIVNDTLYYSYLGYDYSIEFLEKYFVIRLV